MGRHDKLLVIGALNFLSLSILYFKNDPESVFISILVPLYQIFYVAGLYLTLKYYIYFYL